MPMLLFVEPTAVGLAWYLSMGDVIEVSPCNALLRYSKWDKGIPDSVGVPDMQVFVSSIKDIRLETGYCRDDR